MLELIIKGKQLFRSAKLSLYKTILRQAALIHVHSGSEYKCVVHTMAIGKEDDQKDSVGK